MAPESVPKDAERKRREPFTRIAKRDGRIVPFDASKITAAIHKAGKATGEFSERTAEEFTIQVVCLVQSRLAPDAIL